MAEKGGYIRIRKGSTHSKRDSYEGPGESEMRILAAMRRGSARKSIKATAT